jgi:hypothetical protein
MTWSLRRIDIGRIDDGFHCKAKAAHVGCCITHIDDATSKDGCSIAIVIGRQQSSVGEAISFSEYYCSCTWKFNGQLSE